MTTRESRLQEAAKQLEIVRDEFEEEANGADDGEDADAAQVAAELVEDAQATVSFALDIVDDDEADLNGRDEGEK